jgi:hypothetical protein
MGTADDWLRSTVAEWTGIVRLATARAGYADSARATPPKSVEGFPRDGLPHRVGGTIGG